MECKSANLQRHLSLQAPNLLKRRSMTSSRTKQNIKVLSAAKCMQCKQQGPILLNRFNKFRSSHKNQQSLTSKRQNKVSDISTAQPTKGSPMTGARDYSWSVGVMQIGEEKRDENQFLDSFSPWQAALSHTHQRSKALSRS